VSAVIAAGCIAVVLPGLPGSTTTTTRFPHRAAAAVAWSLVVMGGLTAILAVAARDADDRAFARAQAAAAESFELTVGVGDPATDPPATDPPATDQPVVDASPSLAAPSAPTTPEPNSPVVGPPPPAGNSAAAGLAARPPIAFLEFRRPSDGSRPVTDDRLFVGTDVSEAGLQDGPGHYPTTSRPGREGNMAVAGHRTGWGAPFYRLDELQPGDRVLVGDRRGRTFVYRVARTEVVDPEDSWVLGEDPLGTGERTLTLTTCDPPGINSKRLIVFATLVDRPSTPPAT
jgi:LPXTG-site transpeptidase (sortase) family protein